MNTHSPLANITIVLKDTRTPANIGSVARCMANTGLRYLALVNPPVDPDNQAGKLAAGADGILAQASRHASLAEAIAGHGLVIGTSRHGGRLRQNVRTPRDMAANAVPLLSRNRIAIVFGNEINGLENQDLDLCQEIIAIPSDEAFPSLNLSHAVMVIAYELFLAGRTAPPLAPMDLATSEDLERFLAHLQTLLVNAGFFGQEQPERLMRTFRQIFGRARLSARDVSILRGVISAFDRSTH